MEGLTIRKAQESDLEEILQLFKSLDDGNTWATDLSVAKEKFSRMQQYPNYCVYAAEYDGRIVGTFELLIMDNLAHNGASSAIVEDVAVRGGMHGKGIGKAMMQKAMQISRENGCYKMMLSSNLKREDAHRFYERLGFTQHGVSFFVSL